MEPITFSTTLLQGGKAATGIVVPPEIVERLGKGKKPAVKVTIKGYTYRSTVATMGGDFMIGVSAEVRGKTGVKGGDEIEVQLELDTEPRVLAIPEDLQASLDKDAEAKTFFEGLSYSNKRRFTIPIEDAKSPETRARRIESTIAKLRERKL